VLDKKLGWNAVITDSQKETQVINNITLAILVGPVGLSIGSYIGGYVVSRYGI